MQHPLKGNPGAFLALCLVVAPLAAEPRQELFQPGVRWTRSASALDAWIPGSVSFAGGEEHALFVAPHLNPHVELLSSAGWGSAQAILRWDQLQGAVGSFAIEPADDQGSILWLAQFPQPTSTQRSTRVERHDARAALQGNSSLVWSHDSGLLVNAPAFLANCSLSNRAYLAVYDPNQARVQLDCLQASDGLLLSRSYWPASGLQALVVAENGERLALSAGNTLWVLDAWTNPVWSTTLPTPARSVACSADATCLVVGVDQCRVYQAGSTDYTLAWSTMPLAGEWCMRVACASDGSSIAAGFWNAAQGSLRWEWRERANAALRWTQNQPNAGLGLQNFPEAVCISADGQRAAFASWGDGAVPAQLQLIDASGALLLSADLPGSARGLALDARGRRALVSYKQVHANQFGSLGAVSLFDTGENQLVQRTRAAIGGSVSLAARRPGANFVYFLSGPPSATPQSFPGTTGSLLLQRNQLSVWARPADASGAAEWEQALPMDPQWIGKERYFQAAFRQQGQLHFGAELERVLIL